MWSIYEKKSLVRQARKIPKPVLKRYEIWKRIIEMEGPSGLREINGLNDEALKGDWQGYRSSRLNKQWRVIYRIENNVCEVYVIDVNAHDYKRR